MITTNAISVALTIIIQAILTVKGGDTPTVTCRGVIFETDSQATDSQPVWPLDTCINIGDESQAYQCGGSNTVQVAYWNETDCKEGNGYTDWYEDVEATVLSDGCQLTNPCGIAVLDEWLNPTDLCAIDDTQMHLPDISIALDQCWYDIKQQSYVTLSCTAKDDPTVGFGFDVTWTKYADSTGCTGTPTTSTIDGTGSKCFSEMTDSPYFENIQCKFPTKVFETECRSVSENNGPTWPLDECFGSQYWDSDAGAYQLHSWKYFCEQSAPGESWEIRKSEWDNTMSCEGDSTESGVPTSVNADGCNRGKICSFVNVDEYLNSKGSDGLGTCVKNEQGVNNNHVNVSIVTDICINQDGNYFKLSCENSDGTTFDKLTYTTYTDDECLTVDITQDINGEAGCLDIDVAPYFANIKCKKTSPVFETECRSVSPNNNVNWAIDECISTSTYDIDQGVIQEASSMYKCDENYDLYEVKYDNGDCTGNEEYDYLVIGINAHGCARSKPCNLINVDEYLMSKGADGQQACVKNEQGENNLHIIAGIVEGVCFLNNHGEYTKLSCEGDTVTYETFPDAEDENCEGTVETQTISAESCLDIPEAPYFNSVTCDFVAPTYDTPTSCKAVWENYNTIWPIGSCLTFDNPNGLQSKQYVCDSNNELMVKEYDDANDCAGTATRSERPDNIARYDCESLVDCPMASITEYLNSKKDGVCAKNDADPTAEDYMFIKVDVVLNTCWQSHHGDYIRVRCQTDESGDASDDSSDFGVRLIYENYTDSVGCVADLDNNIPIVDIIDSPDCLDIPETAFISALTCTGAEADDTDPAMQPTEMPEPGAGGANSIKNNSIFGWITMVFVAYWMLN